jgi:hypothetical protein
MFEKFDKLFLEIIRSNEKKVEEGYCRVTAFTLSKDAFFLGTLSCRFMCYFHRSFILHNAADQPPTLRRHSPKYESFVSLTTYYVSQSSTNRSMGYYQICSPLSKKNIWILYIQWTPLYIRIYRRLRWSSG